MTTTPQTPRFEPPDLEIMRVTARLSPAMRIRRLLNTRRVLVGIIRGRLRVQFPELSPHELNLKMLEEIERVNGLPRAEL
jgi:hypothetical protein